MSVLYGYIRIKKNDSIEAVSSLFEKYSCAELVIDDELSPKTEESKWHQLKVRLAKEKGSLLVDSLRSLGKTGREIFKELTWIQDNNISLYVITIPTSFENERISTKVLVELFEEKAKRERANTRAGQIVGQERANSQGIKSGRPLTPYPENWNELYDKWSRKEISATIFLEKTGLKKGTFYNLLKRFKHELKIKDETKTEVV